MRVYEIVFVVAPTAEEGEVESLITQFSDILSNQGGKVAKIDRMGKRKLAYPIQKFAEGYYVVLTLEGSGSEIAEVERRMRVTDSVIRYLTVRIDEDLKRAEKFRQRRSRRVRAGRSSRTAPAQSATPVETTTEEETNNE
jgi:small subunit ribosomal protein S6